MRNESRGSRPWLFTDAPLGRKKQHDGMKIRLDQFAWTNPHPAKRIETLDLVSFHDKTPCGPFCVALTAEGP